MYLSPALLVPLFALALARPQDAAPAAAGSKKNVYLASCTSRSLYIADTASAVVYYNGPVSGSSPADVGVVSEPARDWEGQTRRVTLSAGRFTSSIAASADALLKSQIAGIAKLGDEDLVCFVDGTSTFRFREGLLGLGETTCKADYWCASTDVGT
ncbi:hypothetical protein BDU57DRAFT_524019 [Ampelomyces quisqualis]|uniref:Uncharacterized protein n=1 Tax=Ampelomyces quisqualis TaxID=50730 RepID=A0A6A5QBN6_AMPQU|nr:hypothetical protein BDU57DRAFT_524019 [Ampelomyces quisqualis]